VVDFGDFLMLFCGKLHEATEGEQFSDFLRNYKRFSDFFWGFRAARFAVGASGAGTWVAVLGYTLAPCHPVPDASIDLCRRTAGVTAAQDT
tara:strand:- start:483 stop:755 length:273 start_codon:yes stop_codon:yes gene_type:complete